ncbi:MAG: beta-ketoacyl synthase chain length factor [Gammaproteobacteria bacterium]
MTVLVPHIQHESGGVANELCFSVKYWCYWQSDALTSAKCWPAGEVLPCNGGNADVGFLPMMQRRRLSPLARAACAVAWRGRQVGGDMPTVFFSRHGESQYYFEMLHGMAIGEPLSPARFSLSVHNAIGGLFSFQTQSYLPYVSLAGGTEGWFAAFIEAACQLLDATKVMIVCYEQPLPMIYRRYVPSPTATTCALAMVLGRAEAGALSLRLSRAAFHAGRGSQEKSLNLLQAVTGGHYQGCSKLESSLWCWSLTNV